MEDELDKNIEDAPTDVSQPQSLRNRYVLIGAFILVAVVALLTILVLKNDNLSPEQAQTRTQQVLEIKDFGATVLEVVSDTRYPNPASELIAGENKLRDRYTTEDGLLIDPYLGLKQDIESSNTVTEEEQEVPSDAIEPGMSVRVLAIVPDANKVKQIDFSEKSRLNIPQTKKEILLMLDSYTHVNGGELDDLTSDTLIQATVDKPLLSGAESFYVREITILQ